MYNSFISSRILRYLIYFFFIQNYLRHIFNTNIILNTKGWKSTGLGKGSRTGHYYHDVLTSLTLTNSCCMLLVRQKIKMVCGEGRGDYFSFGETSSSSIYMEATLRDILSTGTILTHILYTKNVLQWFCR